VSFIDRRVGDVSRITISAGTTRIRFPDAVVSSEPERKEKPDNMHASGSPLGAVYVNELAGQAIAAEKAEKFPVGSIIVREKLAKPDDKEPELVAVMIKREPGFNPAGGDWLFLTADGTLAKIRERQKTGSCLGCHKSERANDFVFPLTAAK